MSKRRFVISDTHFSQDSILNFTDDFGYPLREFTSSEAMDNCMIDRWNSVVKPEDTVIHLGDVGFSRTSLNIILPKLNGRKILVKGNHDKFKLSFYAKHFVDVRSYIFGPYKKFILSHIPIHPASLGDAINIHGHLHTRTLDDPQYINVSVEQIDYTPVLLEDLVGDDNYSY